MFFIRMVKKLYNYLTSFVSRNRVETVEVWENEMVEEVDIVEEEDVLPIIFFDKKVKEELRIDDKLYAEIKRAYRDYPKIMEIQEKVLLIEIVEWTKKVVDPNITESERMRTVMMVNAYKYLVSRLTKGKFWKLMGKMERGNI